MTTNDDHHPIETLLVKAGIFSLHRRLDVVVNDFRNRHAEWSASKEVFEGQNPTPGNRRNYPLSYVVGPVGSGRTYFALRYLKDFRSDRNLPSVLVYGLPWMWHDRVDFAAAERGPAQLAELVLDLLARRIDCEFRQQWRPTKRDHTLNGHVCLVLDDADRPELKGFFEKRSMATAFVRELEASRFAESLMVVVVVGTPALVGRDIDAASDAHFFRVKAWSSDDFFLHLLSDFAPSKA